MMTSPRPNGPAPGPISPVKTATAKTRIGGLAVVCAKCAKRQGLRPKEVRNLLRDAYRDLGPASAPGKGGKRRKLRILESGCLGPCPKRSVAVATGASLAAGRVLLLDPGAGVAGARAALLPEFGPNAGLAAPLDPTGPGEDPPGSP
jgi:hypothetical protein